ncbi:hypothetical protein PVL29_024307 [Vitis rotundifolia]|uniref:ATP synthase delta chain, chloroplastic n=1 Tax=Vitis rotundifolia TaxID=103349 RepID=A0AA39D8V9_VITRO|nr:hypothetical protein PVL29_024307 [Vitis rotundifolia]
MAAMQHSPVTFQSRSPPSAAKSLSNKPLNLSFSGNFPSFRLTNKVAGKSRSGASSARMSATAAGSYAAALADVAKSNGTLDTTAEDVEKIEKVLSEEQVLNFFCNPTIDIEKKRNVLDEIAKTSGIQPHTMNFLNILVDMKRIDLIKEIAKEFELVYNRLTDTELAVVSSVVQLESEHLAQIAKQVQKLTGSKNVRIKTAIDPSLVAGFTIRYGSGGSKLIDMSVKKQLEEIAAELELGNIQLV